MIFNNLHQFKEYARKYIAWKKKKGESINFVAFEARTQAKFNAKTGKITLTPHANPKDSVIIVECTLCE